MAMTAPIPPVPNEGWSQKEYEEMERWYEIQEKAHLIGLTVTWGIILMLLFALFFI